MNILKKITSLFKKKPKKKFARNDTDLDVGIRLKTGGEINLRGKWYEITQVGSQMVSFKVPGSEREGMTPIKWLDPEDYRAPSAEKIEALKNAKLREIEARKAAIAEQAPSVPVVIDYEITRRMEEAQEKEKEDRKNGTYVEPVEAPPFEPKPKKVEETPVVKPTKQSTGDPLLDDLLNNDMDSFRVEL